MNLAGLACTKPVSQWASKAAVIGDPGVARKATYALGIATCITRRISYSCAFSLHSHPFFFFNIIIILLLAKVSSAPLPAGSK
jgi:hypothetical protein